jgi:hypothetical protein
MLVAVYVMVLFVGVGYGDVAATIVGGIPSPYPEPIPANHSYGWRFFVNEEITITHLGMLDWGDPGLVGSYRVGLWELDESGQGNTTLLRSVSISGEVGTLAENYRYVEIPELTLAASPTQRYLIGVWTDATYTDGVTIQPTSSVDVTSAITIQNQLGRKTTGFDYPWSPISETDHFGVNFSMGPLPGPTPRPPEITTVTIEPTPLGSATTAVATFSDEDGGTHTATIAWTESGTPEDAVVDDAAMTVSGSHTYGETGVYTVTVTVAADDGGTASSTAYAAVYDPAAVSFATGGGSIADAGSPCGKAWFGFFVRQWGWWGPCGRLRFRWANKCFQSTAIDYLVISEDQTSVWFGGVGTVNGSGEYYFMAEVGKWPNGLDLIIFDEYETPGLVDLLWGWVRIRQWN